MKKIKYVVQKIPLEKTPADNEPNFVSQPQMYLELIENKQKVIPAAIGKDFIPSPMQSPLPVRVPSPAQSIGSSSSISTRSKPQTPEEYVMRGPPSAAAASSSSPLYKKLQSTPRPVASGAPRKALPTLSELQKQKKISVPRDYVNLNRVSDPEEEQMKRDYLFRFTRLKKIYPDVDIPKFSIYDSFQKMKTSYDEIMKSLAVDDSISNYKQFLSYAFMGLEFGLGKWGKLDMAGFTQQQLMNIQKYEEVLLEMGEKSYAPAGESQWPPEVRLAFLLITNTALFVFTKLLMKRAGGGGNASKMKGPNIRPEELNK